jgi:hypothetical protein
VSGFLGRANAAGALDQGKKSGWGRSKGGVVGWSTNLKAGRLWERLIEGERSREESRGRGECIVPNSRDIQKGAAPIKGGPSTLRADTPGLRVGGRGPSAAGIPANSPGNSTGNVPGGLTASASGGDAEYDALADLFLGEGFGPSGDSGAAKPRAGDSARNDDPIGAVSSRGSTRARRDVVSDAPVRPSSPASKPGPAALNSQLKLAAADAVVGPRIEALLQAHLPIMASAWVTQYAKHLASAGAGVRAGATATGGMPSVGGVALVRIRSGAISLEIFGAAAIAKLPSGPVSSLSDAVWRATLVASTWLLHVDETREAEFLQVSGLSAVTVLSGADEPALVACYRTVKGVAMALREHGESPMPQVQVAFLGASSVRAATAGATIQRTSQTFLGIEVNVAATIERIGACPSVTVFRGPEPKEGLKIADLVSGVTCASALGPISPPVRTAERASERGAERGEHEDADSMSIGGARARRGTSARQYSDADGGIAGRFPTVSVRPEELDLLPPLRAEVKPRLAKPRPDTTPRATEPRGDREADQPGTRQRRGDGGSYDSGDVQDAEQLPVGSLAQLLGEFDMVDARCPYAPSVEMAVGGDARLHLITFMGDAEHESATPTVRAAMDQLAAAAEWALDHATLLRAAGVSARLDATLPPISHLMTDRPRDVRRALDSEVRVHVLARTAEGWICRDLN